MSSNGHIPDLSKIGVDTTPRCQWKGCGKHARFRVVMMATTKDGDVTVVPLPIKVCYEHREKPSFDYFFPESKWHEQTVPFLMQGKEPPDWHRSRLALHEIERD